MKKNAYYLLILLAASFVTHFIFYGQPAQVVFDEVYFARYGSDYLTGSYYFDPHPPLGKELIGATAYLAGARSDATDYSSIGDSYANSNYLWYRLLPTLAGTLVPAVVFLLALELDMSSLAAFAAGLLVILENSLLVQSRMTSLDSMLLLSGFISMVAYFRYRKARNADIKSARKHSLYYLISASFTAALALSFKWTGLTFLGMILLAEVIDLIRAHLTLAAFKRFIGRAAVFLGVGLVVYFSIFIPHFALLTTSGQGDAFMPAAFQKTLSGSMYQNDPTLAAPDLLQKFTELNKEMYAVNASMTATHPYSSTWYTWPLMIRPVFYWQSSDSDRSGARAYIYYLGNPLIYWFGTLSVLGLAVYLVAVAVKKKSLLRHSRKWNIAAFVVVAYLANLIPFSLIKRPMFLYHYEAGLVWSILAIALVLDAVPAKRKAAVICSVLAIMAIVFLFFSPLTYGTPLTDAGLHARMWLSTWR